MKIIEKRKILISGISIAIITVVVILVLIFQLILPSSKTETISQAESSSEQKLSYIKPSDKNAIDIDQDSKEAMTSVKNAINDNEVFPEDINLKQSKYIHL